MIHSDTVWYTYTMKYYSQIKMNSYMYQHGFQKHINKHIAEKYM